MNNEENNIEQSTPDNTPEGIETPENNGSETPTAPEGESAKAEVKGTTAPPSIDKLKLDDLTRTLAAFALIGDEKSVAQRNAMDEIDRFTAQYKGEAVVKNKLQVTAIALSTDESPLTADEIGKSKLKPELFRSAIMHYALPEELYPTDKDRAKELALVREAVYVKPTESVSSKAVVSTETDVRLSAALMRGSDKIESFDLADEKQVAKMQSLVFKVFYAACLYFEIPDRLTKFLMLLVTYNDGDKFTATNDQLAQFGKVNAKTVQRARQYLLEYIDETQNALVQMTEVRDENGKVAGTEYSLPFAQFLVTTLQTSSALGFAEIVQELTSKMQEQRELDAAYHRRLEAAKATGDKEKIEKVEKTAPKNALDRIPEKQRVLAQELIERIEDAKAAIQTPTEGTNERIAANKLESLKEMARRVKTQLLLVETPQAKEAITEIDRFLLEGTNFNKTNIDAYRAYLEQYEKEQEDARQKHNARLAKAAQSEQSFEKALKGYRKLAENQVGQEADEELDATDAMEVTDQVFQDLLLNVNILAVRCADIAELDLDDEQKKLWKGAESYKMRLIQAIETAFRTV